jgi:hypothetical protein
VDASKKPDIKCRSALHGSPSLPRTGCLGTKSLLPILLSYPSEQFHTLPSHLRRREFAARKAAAAVFSQRHPVIASAACNSAKGASRPGLLPLPCTVPVSSRTRRCSSAPLLLTSPTPPHPSSTRPPHQCTRRPPSSLSAVRRGLPFGLTVAG